MSREFMSDVCSRRSALRVGGAGVLGLAMARLLDAKESARSARAKAVIFLHQWGGPAQHETFDMKPNAPVEVRNIFKPISSTAPGIHVCELLPRTAKVMDKVCVVRTIAHSMKNHASAGYYSLTGHAPPTDDQRLRDATDLFPAFGSIVDRFLPNTNGMPTFAAFPHVIRDGSVTPGQHASFLGKVHNPLLVTQDPNNPSFALPELRLPASITPERLENRKTMLNTIDEQSRLLEHSLTAQGIDQSYKKALAMLTTPKVKQAFDILAEPAEIRERYGRTTYGQSCLLARRLVEAGVRFVNVYLSDSIGGDTGGWDVHGTNGRPMNPILKKHLLPITDQTLPTLIQDLDERGLLDSTLILWMGEFGRTPRINRDGGRDHWPQCYSALLAGGGVKRGWVHGASDKIGAYPLQDPVKPDDISATVFALLGINPETEVRDPLNRPLPLSYGEPLRGIMA